MSYSYITLWWNPDEECVQIGIFKINVVDITINFPRFVAEKKSHIFYDCENRSNVLSSDSSWIPSNTRSASVFSSETE